MAGHLPIATKEFHRALVKLLKSIKPIKELKEFDRVKFEGGQGQFFMRLSKDYAMDEEHGMVDDEIISFSDLSKDHVIEIHLDHEENINQVYKVM
jgi:hypothetical protein